MSKIKLALDVVSDLKSLAESIETLVHAMESNEAAIEEPTKKKSKAKAKAKAEETEIKEPEIEEVPEEKQPTLEEVRAAMADKSRDGHREAVKAIITKYGANNLSSLDPKHYAAALKEVGELK
jgi:F0F1-type ATP synthase membrane subunit b/b'